MPNRVKLADACFASPVGNTPDQAVAHLQSGTSGVRALQGQDYLATAALIQPDPGSVSDVVFHPRTSARFNSALASFCQRLETLAARAGRLDKLFVICKVPFYSKFRHPSLDDWNEEEFVQKVLQTARIELDPARVVLFQAACSTGLMALNLAVREVARGDSQSVLIMGIETEINPEKFLAYKKLGVLSSESDPLRSCQPFSRARSGLVPGETAVALLLDAGSLGPGDVALCPGHATADAFRLTDGLDSGEYLKRCLERTLGDEDVESIDFVCPHGTSTPLNDRIEGAVLDQLFAARSRPVPVVPLKQYIGHTLNSSGLLETVLCAELLRHNLLPPVLNPDPQEPYEHLQFLPRCERRPLRRALKVSVGFGGLNAALMIEKVG